ncbi:MAG: hypothetical protein IJ743_03530 [Bacilli bacterium]|nr:hypothetical protein [Bacilli bacterium]
MVNYRYLGYGITNEQGIATLDHDANGDPITHSYTGTGAGKVDIVASTDKPVDISDSSLQSETYELMDAMFYDDGTSASNNLWRLNNATLTRDSEYTTVKSTAQWGNIQLSRNNVQVNLLENNSTIVIEMDLLGCSSQKLMSLRYYDGTHHYLNFPALDGHHKVTITSNSQKFEVDGVVKQNWSVNIPNIYLQTSMSESNLELQFKQLKVYPI